MANLDQELIQKLSRLCRIALSPEDEEQLLQDLGKILSYVEQLQEVDTERVPPCSSVLSEMTNVLREDELGELLDRDLFLANSPDQIGGMIRVPPVIQ